MAFGVQEEGVGEPSDWASQLAFSGCVQGDWLPKNTQDNPA